MFHLRAGVAEALVPALGLVAGVGEQQGGDAGLQGRHQIFIAAQAEVAGPGKAVDRLGQQATDLRCPGNRCGDQARFAGGTQGAAGGLFEIADRGADRPGAQARLLAAQPAQAELGLAAAFAAHQLVPLIQHHRLKASK